MGPSHVFILALHLLAAGGMFAVAARVYRRRQEPGMRSFATLVTLFGSLAVGLTVLFGLGVAGYEHPLFDVLASTLTGLVLLAGVPWIVFVLQYTGRASLVTRRRVALLALPGVAYVATVFAYSVRVDGTESWEGTLSTVDVLLWSSYLFSFLFLVGLIAIGALLLLRTTHVYSHMSTLMGVLLAAPLLVLVPTIAFLPQFAVAFGTTAAGGLVNAGFVLGVVCYETVLRRDDAFGSTSAAAGPVGRETILEEHSAAVFTVDDEHRVVEFNDAARETFDLPQDEPLGEPVEDVLGATVDDLTTDAPLGVNAVDDLWTESTVFLETTEGRRRFRAGVSDLTDEHDRNLGLVISLEDVTERALREQRIGILNRVLRHNLRNKLSIVRGHAEMVPDAGEELDEYAETIETAAEDLLALGERAREVEQLLAADEDASSEVDAVAESVVAELEHTCDETTFQTELDGPVQVSIPREPLEFVLSELAENAAKHNDAADPRVTVNTEREGDWASVSVLDNGPTLDDQELVAITAEEESPLEHGSGLGLWSVRWVVTSFGGQLSVEENEPRGSVVTLLLPVDDDGPDHLAARGTLGEPTATAEH